MKRQLIVASNRLPVTLVHDDDKIEFKGSSGGLVTALIGINAPFKWVGWLGTEVKEEHRREVDEKLLRLSPSCYSVHLNQEEANLYYNGFSNSIIWPLFFNSYNKSVDNHLRMKEQWKAYKRVNEKFAEKILELYEEGDLIWIHDYHLMLLPQILRKRKPNLNIIFFLHTPFPSPEILRMLSVNREILEGLLSSNLIGFHISEYSRHFINSCRQLLGSTTTYDGVLHNGLYVKVGVFPIGINVSEFAKGCHLDETKNRFKFYKERYKGKKIILGIDRLDHTKGIKLKLMTFKKFLEKYPEMVEKVILIQICIPTRESMPQYQDLNREINQIIGQINSQYSTFREMPIHCIKKSVKFPDLCALYEIGDVCIVSSIQDGLNLVCSEYVLCQHEGYKYNNEYGVLVLSEFAGASRLLGGSLIINPWNIEKCADTYYEALNMDRDKRRIRHFQNYKVVSKNTVEYWTNSILNSFEESLIKYSHMDSLPYLEQFTIKDKYLTSKSRLFLLDYDGIFPKIGNELPSNDYMNMLMTLSSDPHNRVYIMSMKDKKTIMKIFGQINGLGLVAENGMYVRHPREDEWTSLCTDIYLGWMNELKDIVYHFQERTPGAIIEERMTNLVFDYSKCENQNYGKWQANELKCHIQSLFTKYVNITQDDTILSFRSSKISKGISSKKLSTLNTFDFIFVAGNDDEMFELENSILCFVENKKNGPTRAKYKIKNDVELVNILSKLVQTEMGM